VSGSISLSGFMAKPSSLNSWVLAGHNSIRDAVAREMKLKQTALQRAAGGAVSATMRVNKASFPAAWRTKVYTSKPQKMPAVLVQSKIFWMGAHEYGAQISGKRGLLIPFGNVRIGAKAFRRLLDSVLNGKSGFFKKIGSRLILFARVGSTKGLRGAGRLRRAFQQARSTMQKTVKGDAFPIAVYVRSVRLQPRFSLKTAVTPVVRSMARAIENRVSF